jgi:hypothetical protein
VTPRTACCSDLHFHSKWRACKSRLTGYSPKVRVRGVRGSPCLESLSDREMLWKSTILFKSVFTNFFQSFTT